MRTEYSQMFMLFTLIVSLVLSGCVAQEAVSQMGATNPCHKMTPRFVGYEIVIDQWLFGGPDNLRVVVSSARDVTLTEASIDWNDAGTWIWTGSKNLEAGQATTIKLQGSSFQPGQCAEGEVEFQYDTDSTTQLVAVGEGNIQGPAP